MLDEVRFGREILGIHKSEKMDVRQFFYAIAAFGPDILESLEMLGVAQFSDSAVIIKCRMTTKPCRPWAVAREMNRRIKRTFDARGIEVLFPHRTLYWDPDHQPTRDLSPSLAPSFS